MIQGTKIKRAIFSVFDKEGIISLAEFLLQQKVEIVATEGTGRTLKKHGLSYTPLAKITKVSPLFGGRVKTISFEIAGALLFRREEAKDCEEAQQRNIRPIDLLVCNFYPRTRN